MFDTYPSKRGLFAHTKQISSKHYKIHIDGKYITLYAAEKEGLIDVFYDKDLGIYSYIEKSSGNVVSYFLAFPESDWPDWLKERLDRNQIAGNKDQFNHTIGAANA